MRRTRREVLRITAVGFGSYLVLGAGCRRGSPSTEKADASAPGPALKTFTPEQFETVCAACERILPRDEDPGANDLGVPFYVDAQLADPDLDEWKRPFMGGLAVLDRQARKQFGTPFHLASPDDQDRLLAKWQRGKSGETRFFTLLMNLTLEGAFGDPSHGGNKGGAGFAMAGFTPGAPTPGHPMMHHHGTP